jgi:L-ribulose-5-phosphate 3-epimerase
MTRRQFLESAAAAGTFAAIAPRAFARGAEPGFRGTLCFFSKHLPRLDGRGLARALKPLGFAGVDLTARPGGHVDPKRVSQDLPVYVAGIRDEGLAVPMITTDLTAVDDPAARPTLETAAALRIPFFKPGYYRYAFQDVRGEVAAAGGKLRALAELSARAGVHLGYHNHAGYIGGNIWDIAPTIDALPAKSASYYFDVRHAVVEGGDGGWRTAFGLAAPRLAMIAVKDFYWEKTATAWRIRNCPMGEGMVNWKAYFAMLAKAGFHGPVSLHLEYEVPGATPEAQEQSTLAAAARDIAFVKARLAEAYLPDRNGDAAKAAL